MPAGTRTKDDGVDRPWKRLMLSVRSFVVGTGDEIAATPEAPGLTLLHVYSG